MHMVFKRPANRVRPWMLGGKKKQRSGVECVGSGGVPWRRLFSLHTLGTELASAPRQSHVSSLRAVYFRCSSQNVSFDPEYCSVRVSVVSGQIWRWNTGPLVAERRAREERDVVSRFLSLCVTHCLNLAFLSDCVMISTDRNSAHNRTNVLVAVISIFIAFVGFQMDSTSNQK